MLYTNRKTKGQLRQVFNESLSKIPGMYNDKASVEITVRNNIEAFDIFNLTSAGRVLSNERHFEVVHKALKDQLKVEQFDDYGLPVQDTQRLVGRIINMNHEDPKLNDGNIGLLNLSEENNGGISKIKLQLSEVQSYSFFEGEIVVAEGVYDSTQSKLNVSRIYKPTLQGFERPSYSLEQLRKFSGEFYKERAI